MFWLADKRHRTHVAVEVNGFILGSIHDKQRKRGGGMVHGRDGLQHRHLTVIGGLDRGAHRLQSQNLAARPVRNLGHRMKDCLSPRGLARLGHDRTNGVNEQRLAADFYPIGMPQQRDEQAAEDDSIQCGEDVLAHAGQR